MLNVIWIGMIVVAVVVGAATGRMEAVTKAAFDSARGAVEIALGLVGFMALWLGAMKVAEEAGLVRSLARGLRPVARRLFPGVPEGHPALGAMAMNMAANLLGLGNAATPLGLKAMAELDSLNASKGTASDAMVMFLALNTSCVTVVPATIIAVRSQLASASPAEIVLPTVLASACATVVAATAARLLQGWHAFRPVPQSPPGEAAAAADEPGERP